MGLIFSSTLQAEPRVSPMCNCAIRLVAQWDLTVGDLRARNLWFRSFSRPFHISLEDLRHGEWSSGLAVCSGTLLMPAPPSLPKAHLHMGPFVPWFGLGSMFSFRAYPQDSGLHRSLCSLGRPETLRWVVEDYFRRKRCARMAASKGLTGWASWPRRLTGGMLPNWRFVRKLLASWIVFFSSASSSCWRM